MSEGSAGEGTNVFLVRADAAHFEQTVSSPVDLGDYPDRPAPLADLEEARLASVPEGDRNLESFEQMEPNDLLLFHRDGRYVGVGRVGQAFEDDGWAGEQLWNDGAGHVFTVEDFAAVDVGKAAVHRIFDYSPSYSPSALMHVAEDRVTNQLDAIDLAVRRYDEQES